MIPLINYVAAAILLLVGSIEDIRTREVADWLNFSMMIFGVGSSLIYSLVLNDYTIVGASVVGLVFTIGLGFLMFYTGQWGGGDSKMMMALGALLGLWIGHYQLIALLLLIIVAGAFYGIIWSFGLMIKHWSKFKLEFNKIIRKRSVHLARRFIVVFGILALAGAIYFTDGIAKMSISLFVIAVYVMFYLWLLVKSVENGCLIKKYPISKLTEGDWILKDVKVKGKYICGPEDLGISKAQIKLLKKHKVKQVIVKEGIPFVPSFLLGYILLLLLVFVMKIDLISFIQRFI